MAAVYIMLTVIKNISFLLELNIFFWQSLVFPLL